MHIKIIRQCILFVLLGVVGSVSVAAERQFCVVNNAGKDVVLSVTIETHDQEDGFFGSDNPDNLIGILNHVADTPGYASSADGYSYLNKGCIVLEAIGAGRSMAGSGVAVPFVPLFPGENPPTSSSEKWTTLKYTITAKSDKYNYKDPIKCDKPYLTAWIWPDNSVATVSLKDGKMVCDLEINPVAKKREPSLDERIRRGDVKIINSN